jgi:hypothetical protein
VMESGVAREMPAPRPLDKVIHLSSDSMKEMLTRALYAEDQESFKD